MRIILVVIFLTLCLGSWANIKNRQDAYKRMKQALEEYRDTGKISSSLEPAAKEYNSPNFFYSPTSFENNEICTTCELITERIVYNRLHGMNDTEFEKELLFFCKLYSGENERVCEGLVKINAPVFLYIIDNTSDFNATDICGTVLQSKKCKRSSRFDWSLEIPVQTTAVNTEITQAEATSFKILHISDIHYDPRYTANKSNNCGEPICCQDDQPDATSAADSCGFWSSYTKADIPWRFVVNALEQTQKHEYDLVYFTGDIIHHRYWSTNEADNIRIFTQVLDAFNEYYKVPVVVVLGNHEAHPSNQFTEIKQPSYSGQWMYDILFQKLSKWFPVNEIKKTILKGGYYTVSPKKGFRIVALNNNVCNLANWWLLHNPRDPYDQLKWLIEVLMEAEKNNEKVHLIYHMNSGSGDFYDTWAREFRRIVDRFSNTITTQFNGHTHKDEFYVYYNMSNPNQAINVAWNGASIVPYEKSNPSYKILSVDDKTFELRDFEEWTCNLTKANLDHEKNPEWFKLYSFKNAYGVKSLRAQDITKLIKDLVEKPELLHQYYRYKFRDSDVANAEACNNDCRKSLLCEIVITEYGVNNICDKVREMYDLNKY